VRKNFPLITGTSAWFVLRPTPKDTTGKAAGTRLRGVATFEPTGPVRQILVTFIALLAAGAAGAADPVRGTQGLVPLDYRIEAGGDRPLACAASIAHWYSTELGRVEPGGSLVIALWRDPATGAVYRLNEVGDRMPVERLWCGIEGRAWATGADLALERLRGDVAPALALACEPEGDRVRCVAA
jgi:hypothetical protein